MAPSTPGRHAWGPDHDQIMISSPLIERDTRISPKLRAIARLARAYLAACAADLSLGRPPLNATASMALITFRWMISFLSMVM